MSRQELADAVNAYVASHDSTEATLDANQIGKMERGHRRWPGKLRRAGFRHALGADSDRDLGFYVIRSTQALTSSAEAQPVPEPQSGGHHATISLSLRDKPKDASSASIDARGSPEANSPDTPEQVTRLGDTMRRRTILGAGAGTLFAAALSDNPHTTVPVPNLVEALTTHELPSPDGPIDLNALTMGVAAAKRDYQSCHYQRAAADLPPLLNRIRVACQQTGGDDRLRAYGLAADAYQVAGSVLLKQGDISLAVLAADRSMNAADESGDPVSLAASARIVTHALMSSGHLRHATRMAIIAAERLERDHPLTPSSVSVLGALLLRGSLASARDDDRDTANELLSEADVLASRLGRDANERWTAFGPTNVLLHRVSVAVSLGDAGRAIGCAQRVPLDKVGVAERRACLFVDVARALTQWGKPERAYQALLAAEQTAPEEIATRPSVRQLVVDLIRITPASLYPDLRELANRIGVH